MFGLRLRRHGRAHAVFRLLGFTLMLIAVSAGEGRSADPYSQIDPYWLLLHEPAVLDELNLSDSQFDEYRELLDALDLQFFPVRNKSREEAVAGLAKIVEEVRRRLPAVLQPSQLRRLNEILMWRLGTEALIQDDVADKLRFDESQRKRIKDILDKTRESVAAIEKEVAAGKPRAPLEKKFTDLKTSEQKQILRVLKTEQVNAWKKLLGETFDVTQLGQTQFKAPALVDTGEWVNSSGLTLDELQGKVVVVHFYASGCINCIRNYPWYREWHDRFRDGEFVMIGIHTPETEAERNLAGVRQKADDEKLAFPILLDVDSENWNAWGNSMWPCVYIIDKRGYLRKFWPGELNWQGNNGEEYMRKQIESLLEEPAS